MLLLKGEMKVSSYLEIMDGAHRDMLSFGSLGEELPDGATIKRGSDLKPDDKYCLIIDSPRYVPMGVRVLSGQARGICIL